MPVIRVEQKSDDPLTESAAFHAAVLPEILAAIAADQGDLVLVFPADSHAQRDWRRAMIATLAREKAPVRVNGVAGDDEAAIVAGLRYLAAAPAITGHYLSLDGSGAGSVLE
jgi:hypothetical protein